MLDVRETLQKSVADAFVGRRSARVYDEEAGQVKLVHERVVCEEGEKRWDHALDSDLKQAALVNSMFADQTSMAKLFCPLWDACDSGFVIACKQVNH